MRGDSLARSGFFAILGLRSDWRGILHGQADPRAPHLCQISYEIWQISCEIWQRVVPAGRKS